MSPQETEKGFGTGLRDQLARKRGEQEVTAVVEAPPLDTADPDETVDVETLRSELSASLERERELRTSLADRVEAYERELDADRAYALRAGELDQRAVRVAASEAAVDERERAARDLSAELEAERARLEAAVADVTALDAATAERAAYVEAKLDEIQAADRDRQKSAQELGRRSQAVADRESKTTRATTALAARERETNARLETREAALKRRDEAVRGRERTAGDREKRAAEAEAEAAKELGRISAREQVIAEREQVLHTLEERLRAQQDALDRARGDAGDAEHAASSRQGELDRWQADLAARELQLDERERIVPIASARQRDLDDRETSLTAREAELNRREANVSRKEAQRLYEPDPALEAQKVHLVAQSEELRARLLELEKSEELGNVARERLAALENRLARMDQELEQRSRETTERETAVDLKLAKMQADVEIREDKLERRELLAAELDERLRRKEADLSSYVGQLQRGMDERETDWWTKQLGSKPESLAS